MFRTRLKQVTIKRSNHYGFISFYHHADADRIRQKYNDTVLDRARVKLKFSRRSIEVDTRKGPRTDKGHRRRRG